MFPSRGSESIVTGTEQTFLTRTPPLSSDQRPTCTRKIPTRSLDEKLEIAY